MSERYYSATLRSDKKPKLKSLSFGELLETRMDAAICAAGAQVPGCFQGARYTLASLALASTSSWILPEAGFH